MLVGYHNNSTVLLLLYHYTIIRRARYYKPGARIGSIRYVCVRCYVIVMINDVIYAHPYLEFDPFIVPEHGFDFEINADRGHER